MILTELPDVLPRPLTPANREFRAWFYERWGREHAVVLGPAQRAEFAPWTQRLSIKRCWGGAERFVTDGRELVVDDEHLLILNDGATYGSRIEGTAPCLSMAVFFGPGAAEAVAGAARLTLREALDRGAEPAARAVDFGPHLRPARGEIEQRLGALRQAVQDGERDEVWLDEQLQALLLAMLRAETGWRGRSLLLHEVSRSAHRELLARVDRATDLILSAYAEPLTLDAMAAEARLSKFHFVRLFRRVHGCTPFALLTRVRTRAAARLVERSGLTLDQIAARSGFGSRQTMFRQLKRLRGSGGQALRRGLAERAGDDTAAAVAASTP